MHIGMEEDQGLAFLTLTNLPNPNLPEHQLSCVGVVESYLFVFDFIRKFGI